MNPDHNNYQPSIELPQPQADGGVPSNEKLVAVSPEARGVVVPTSPLSTASDDQQVPQTPLPQPMQVQGSGAAQGAAVNSGTTGLIADDADLIEKEWVMKAKAIVLQTKNDPHAQNLEMNKVKADYLKKRYNKDLKVSES